MTMKTTNMSATDISRAANTGDGSHAALVERSLNRCYAKAAEILEMADGPSKALNAAGEKAIEAIADIGDQVATTHQQLTKMQLDAQARYSKLPGMDNATLATVMGGARKQGLAEILLVQGPKMNAAADKASQLCAAFEIAVGLADARTDVDLAAALDGEITPSARASEEFLLKWMSTRTMGELSRLYAVLNTADADPVRITRFERVALLAAAERAGMPVEGLIPFLGGLGRDLAPQEVAAANSLKKAILDTRAKRSPKSVDRAKELLALLRESFRLAVQSTAAHVNAMGGEYNAASIIQQNGAWRPLDAFWIRHGIK